MVYKFFDKKSWGSGIKIEIKQNEQSAKELRKPIIKKFKKWKVYSSFKDDIVNMRYMWIFKDDIVNMQLMSKFNKIIQFLLCLIDIYSKYAWVVLLK